MWFVLDKQQIYFVNTVNYTNMETTTTYDNVLRYIASVGSFKKDFCI